MSDVKRAGRGGSSFQSRLPAFPSKAKADRMEAELRAHKHLPKSAKIIWGINFKTGKWEPQICDRGCQDPARQVALLRNDTRRSEPGASDSNWKRFGRVASFSFLGLLTGCSGSPGDNNGNNTYLDGSVDVDASDGTTDASGLDDGSVTPPNCIEGERQGIEDKYLKLVNPDNGGECDALTISYDLYKDKFTVLCAYSNNRILQYVPGDSPQLTKLGRVNDSAPAPENGETAQVHPRNVHMFSPDNGLTELIAVLYQMENPVTPANVKGGAFLYDANAQQPQQFQWYQNRDLVLRVMHGDDQQGTVFPFSDPASALFMHGRFFVAPENYDRGSGNYIESGILGLPLVQRINGWIAEDEVSLGRPEGGGTRPTAVSPVNDTLFAGVFNGLAGTNSDNCEQPKFGIFNAESPLTFDVALKTISDNIGLDPSWQFVALSTVAKTWDNRNFMVGAENPSTDRYKVLAFHINDLSDVGSSPHSVSSYDIPYELPNQASDGPAMIPTGPIVNIVIGGARAYVTTAGDSTHHGFLLAFDIDVADGTITPVGSKGLGTHPTVADIESVTGDIHQVVARANCSGNDNSPYITRIKADEVDWDSM